MGRRKAFLEAVYSGICLLHASSFCLSNFATTNSTDSAASALAIYSFNHLRSAIPIIARSKEKEVKAMMMMKTKKVKLYGEKLRKLNTAIHERDGNCCIICGRYVDPGEKFHHEPCGALKSDEISKGVTLCYDCHQERHCGAGSRIVKEQIKEYLQGLYGDA